MPPILAGILAIYGLVVSVVISSILEEKSALHSNFLFLAAGISVGLSCLASGFCIGIIGDAGVRASGQQPRMFVGMMMMLIFAEVLGKSKERDRKDGERLILTVIQQSMALLLAYCL